MQVIESLQHSIYIGTEDTDVLLKLTEKYEDNQIVVISDENTFRHCFPLLPIGRKWKTIIIPVGEQHKNIATAVMIWNQLLQYNINRRGLIINLGGGIVGDIGGFCASVWKRGIDFIQISTSLLAMVDASCGGKTGVNFENIKNQLGTFNMPMAVIVNPIFLKTLPQRELTSGFAEMVKHAIIFGNDTHYDHLCSIENITVENIVPFIAESIEIKNNIVLQDPYEKNIRKILNFGHTIGHAVETWSFQTKTPLLHGEAVALGMIYEIKLACNKQLISQKKADQYLNLIKKHFKNIIIDAADVNSLIDIMQYDKKNINNDICFALPAEDNKQEHYIAASIHEIKMLLNH